MKKFFKLKNFMMMLLLCLFFHQSQAQKKFIKTDTQLAEIKKLKVKVEANPSNLKLHEAFIDAYNVDDPDIIIVYRDWLKKYSKEYAIPFTIGRALVRRENPKAGEFLLQASILKPNIAEIWNLIANDASLKGDQISLNIALEKAMKLEPKNPKYALSYAYSFIDSNPEKYDSLSLDIARKFPETEVGAQALYLLAAKSTIQAEKFAYLEQLHQGKFSQKLEWYYSGMLYYFDLLLKTNPDHAFALGLSMILQSNNYADVWHKRLAVADAFLKAKLSLDQAKPNEALSILNQVKLNDVTFGQYIDAKEYLALFKAEAADAAHQTKVAFDTLANLYSKEPTNELQLSLYKYGVKLGLDSLQVAKNIWDKRSSTAKQATEFSLQNYSSSGKTSLADFKGKVVLLTYWFPGCGPCRAEFPHFEAVLKRFNRNNVAYLGLNVEPSQDGAVLPFLKDGGYTFTALRDDEKRMKGNLSASGYPTNYLIDQKGRIIFSNFRIDAENEKTLELMIKETLAAKE